MVGLTPAVLRYAAFSVDGAGGNPAGVVLDARGLDAAAMLTIAADVGYSETAFVFPREGEPNVYDVRFFSSRAEVPFCGHATIVAAIALVERTPAAELIFHTPAGFVSVLVGREANGELEAELSSVAPRVEAPPAGLVEEALAALRWRAADLDPDYPPMLANAGSQHLVLVVRKHERLRTLDYDYDALAAVMETHGLITLQLVWPKSRRRYHARNPFPPGNVVEDPATGAAAAAFGGYLRALGKVGDVASFTIVQGVEMGRPSQLRVRLLKGEPGVRVRGAASPISAEESESAKLVRRPT